MGAEAGPGAGHRPKTTTAEAAESRMNAVGPDLEHTQPRMYGYVVGFRWMGEGRKGSGAGYLERAIWSRGSGGTTWWANENNARVFHQPMP